MMDAFLFDVGLVFSNLSSFYFCYFFFASVQYLNEANSYPFKEIIDDFHCCRYVDSITFLSCLRANTAYLSKNWSDFESWYCCRRHHCCCCCCYFVCSIFYHFCHFNIFFPWKDSIPQQYQFLMLFSFLVSPIDINIISHSEPSTQFNRYNIQLKNNTNI